MIESVFLYSLRSAFVLALLYIPYMLILRKESFFRLNRMVLLLILLLSLVLPAVDIHLLAWNQLAPVKMIFLHLPSGSVGQDTAILLPEVAVETRDTLSSRSPWQWTAMLFVAGMLVAALWRVFQVVQMDVVMRRGSLWSLTRDGVHVYCHADDVPPYSWMNSVVISERDYRENGREILLHETAHVRARHSWDLLFLALVQTLQWWNPLAYILGISLRDVHEYEADDSVLRHGVSARAYQLLLIKKVVGSSSYAFANNFDHSLIIKRITMMQKSKSGKWMYSKVLYILPMATLALSAFATVGCSNQSSGTGESGPIANSEDKVSALTLNRQEKVPERTVSGLRSAENTAEAIKASADYCDTPGVLPQFPGEKDELYRYIGRSVKYPESAKTYGVQGKVLVEFFVNKDGSVICIRPTKLVGLDEKGDDTLHETWIAAHEKDCKVAGRELTPEEKAAYQEGVEAIFDEAVRVVNEMPRWTPGYEDKEKTKPCVTHFTLPLVFRLT